MCRTVAIATDKIYCWTTHYKKCGHNFLVCIQLEPSFLEVLNTKTCQKSLYSSISFHFSDADAMLAGPLKCEKIEIKHLRDQIQKITVTLVIILKPSKGPTSTKKNFLKIAFIIVVLAIFIFQIFTSRSRRFGCNGLIWPNALLEQCGGRGCCEGNYCNTFRRRSERAKLIRPGLFVKPSTR